MLTASTLFFYVFFLPFCGLFYCGLNINVNWQMILLLWGSGLGMCYLHVLQVFTFSWSLLWMLDSGQCFTSSPRAGQWGRGEGGCIKLTFWLEWWEGHLTSWSMCVSMRREYGVAVSFLQLVSSSRHCSGTYEPSRLRMGWTESGYF